jgi:hypothetical protein
MASFIGSHITDDSALDWTVELLHAKDGSEWSALRASLSFRVREQVPQYNSEVKEMWRFMKSRCLCYIRHVMGRRYNSDGLWNKGFSQNFDWKLCWIRDSVVVKALCYKPEDRGFNSTPIDFICLVSLAYYTDILQ